MGLEIECRAWFKGKPGIGKAHLDSAELQFRGALRFDVPLKQVKSVEAKGGQLKVVWPEGDAVLELGAAAEKWALKIGNPRGLLDKLGVKEGQRVAIIAFPDDGFLNEIGARVQDLSTSRARKECDLIFCAVDSLEQLAKAIHLIPNLKAGGALWTIFPKGQKHFGETQVRATMREAGMIDTKVVGFSSTHSSLKWTVAR